MFSSYKISKTQEVFHQYHCFWKETSTCLCFSFIMLTHFWAAKTIQKSAKRPLLNRSELLILYVDSMLIFQKNCIFKSKWAVFEGSAARCVFLKLLIFTTSHSERFWTSPELTFSDFGWFWETPKSALSLQKWQNERYNKNMKKKIIMHQGFILPFGLIFCYIRGTTTFEDLIIHSFPQGFYIVLMWWALSSPFAEEGGA